MFEVEIDTRPWVSAGAGSNGVFPFKSAGLVGGAKSDLGLPRTGDPALEEPPLGVRARAPCGGGTWASPHGWLGPRMRKYRAGEGRREDHRDEEAAAAGAPLGSVGSVGSGRLRGGGAAAAEAGLARRARAAEQASG